MSTTSPVGGDLYNVIDEALERSSREHTDNGGPSPAAIQNAVEELLTARLDAIGPMLVARGALFLEDDIRAMVLRGTES